MNAIALHPAVVRGAATREALLDAAETLIADLGFRTPSHRMIAAQARAQTTLLNYHFGTKEMLFEATVERRAARLCAQWSAELAALESDPRWSTETVLRAWWRPFDEMSREELPWRNYLCVIARLAVDTDSGGWYQHYFGKIERRFRDALAETLPVCDPDVAESGLHYARCLFAEILLHRCGKTGNALTPAEGHDSTHSKEAAALLMPGGAVHALHDGPGLAVLPNGCGATVGHGHTCTPSGFRESDSNRLINFVASGMRGIARTSIAAAD